MFITVYPYNIISILPHFQKKDYFNGNVFLLLFFWIFENLSSMVVLTKWLIGHVILNFSMVSLVSIKTMQTFLLLSL